MTPDAAESDSGVSRLLDRVLDHPQATGLCGVLLGTIGVALLVFSGGNPVSILMAGYAFGMACMALVMQVVMLHE